MVVVADGALVTAVVALVLGVGRFAELVAVRVGAGGLPAVGDGFDVCCSGVETETSGLDSSAGAGGVLVVLRPGPAGTTGVGAIGDWANTTATAMIAAAVVPATAHRLRRRRTCVPCSMMSWAVIRSSGPCTASAPLIAALRSSSIPAHPPFHTPAVPAH